MSVALRNSMGRKKSSEVRKHTALIRVEEIAHEKAFLAASMQKLSLAEYATAVLLRCAEEDIQREAAKLITPAKGKTPKGAN